MPISSHQAQSTRGGDIYFEPTDIQASPHEITEGLNKQDLSNDESYIHESIEDTQRKRWIGAYGSTEGGLPAEKGFAIQIGSELFRLSGASIMSDAPSYFSKFFEEQVRKLRGPDDCARTLYIDRDPETFRDIARHLQGYYIYPRDGQHYVRLFADAQFYSLPRLNKQLFSSEIHIEIGDAPFKVPKDIFSAPGDSPNFFSLGFGMFFDHEESYPGLDRVGLIRPPPIEPPRVQGRSARTFSDLLQLLRGYPLEIRSPEHRAELLRDCRYYNFKGLEQKLIFHNITYNPETERDEIVIRIEDLRQPGISILADPESTDDTTSGWVQYARPYADDQPRDLIIEIGDSSAVLNTYMNVEFHGQLRDRISSLLQVLSNKVSPSASTKPVIPVDGIRCEVRLDAAVNLDGKDIDTSKDELFRNSSAASHVDERSEPELLSKKRKLDNSRDDVGKVLWTIKRGHWRIRVQTQIVHGDQLVVQPVLHAVKLEAFGGQRGRNRAREFLVT